MVNEVQIRAFIQYTWSYFYVKVQPMYPLNGKQSVFFDCKPLSKTIIFRLLEASTYPPTFLNGFIILIQYITTTFYGEQSIVSEFPNPLIICKLPDGFPFQIHHVDPFHPESVFFCCNVPHLLMHSCYIPCFTKFYVQTTLFLRLTDAIPCYSGDFLHFRGPSPQKIIFCTFVVSEL